MGDRKRRHSCHIGNKKDGMLVTIYSTVHQKIIKEGLLGIKIICENWCCSDGSDNAKRKAGSQSLRGMSEEKNHCMQK